MKSMKAAIATGIANVEKHIHVRDDWPQPTLATAVDGKTGKLVAQEKHMIVKVLACALAPGDVRLFAGKTDMMQLPKTGRPYILGSDVYGIVTEISEQEKYFQVGDTVICRFDEPQPNGMCAEYACVKTSLSEKIPPSFNIPGIEACTLPASAAAAKLVAQQFVQKGDRVLVLGASGGVGTFLCQYIKQVQNASFLAATTTQTDLAQSVLGVDRVIDYRVEHWWELESEFCGDAAFDVVIDLVNGRNWQDGACSGTKARKGKNTDYVQLWSGVETEIDMSRGIFSVTPFVFHLMIARPLYAKLAPWCPKYHTPQGLDLKPGDLSGILQDIGEKKIRVVLDPRGPFDFDERGVRDAMTLQKSKHAHGKVVIEICKDDK